MQKIQDHNSIILSEPTTNEEMASINRIHTHTSPVKTAFERAVSNACISELSKGLVTQVFDTHIARLGQQQNQGNGRGFNR